MAQYTREQHDYLLELARATLTAFVIDGDWREAHPDDLELLKEAGAFVTLRIGGQLRGCTGYLRADRPLSRVVQEMAVSAASSDPRFPPLREEELVHLTIGISVLSPLTPVKSVDEIEVGVHGLLITFRGRRGVLLPQVPAERGWDRETYLNNLCYKAGLAEQDWRDEEAVLFSFTAEVFGVD